MNSRHFALLPAVHCVPRSHGAEFAELKPGGTGALRSVALSGHERYRQPKRAANHTGCEHGAAHSEAERQ